MQPYIIGISGVMGAGKSTLANQLSKDLTATLITWDSFDDISSEPEDYIDWYRRGAHYSEFKRPGLRKVLLALKMNKAIKHSILQTFLKPTKYIVFDAPLGRLHSETGEYINTLIHIEVPLDISLSRRLLRDFKSSDKTKEKILEEIEFYLSNSRPLYFDDDLKKTADLILNGMLPTQIQVNLIKQYLNKNSA